MSRCGVLDVRIRVDTRDFRRKLDEVREALMDFFMLVFYRFEIAGENDGTAWGEWDVFV